MKTNLQLKVLGRAGRRSTPPLSMLPETYRDSEIDDHRDGGYRHTHAPSHYIDVESASEAAFMSIDDGGVDAPNQTCEPNFS